MRLVCPNCGAQYEVPADAIPAAGRDVQCSACGHTWFEGGPAAGAAPAAAAPGDDAESDLAWSEPEGVPRSDDDEEEQDDLAELAWQPGVPAMGGGGAAEPGMAADAGRQGDAEPWPAADDDTILAPPRPGAVRSTVTPEIAEILREEAEREARARAEEAGRSAAARQAEADAEADAEGAEIEREIERAMAADAAQEARARSAGADPWPDPHPADPDPADPDPADPHDPRPESVPPDSVPPDSVPPEIRAAGAAPLNPGPAWPDRERQRAEEARRRMSRLRGEAAPVVPPARRDRLPDIEEIDSSLRGAPRPAAAAPAAAAGRGFRLGFGGALLVAALLALLYAYAPRLTAAAPALSPVLDPYARVIDRGRLWLDARMRGMVEDLGGTNAAPPSSTAPASEAPEVQAEPPAAPAPGTSGGG